MKYFIETFGCQMNKNDSELIALSMEKNGFTKAETSTEADIMVFNTCSVRKHAEERVVQRIRTAQRDSKIEKKVTIVAGCMAQRLGQRLINDGIADIVVGPYQSPGSGDLVKDYLKNKSTVFTSQKIKKFSERINPALLRQSDDTPWHRWITITHGCENNCTYCIVPSVRGRLISFSSESIIEYAKQAADAGAIEVSLLGQNVNQYGTDSGDIPFYKLLESIAAVNGIRKINFITSHPKDFTEDIIKVIRDNKNISRSIHLPIQSGSDKILKAMNRGYTIKKYTSIMESIDRFLDDYAVSTDIIVGFPGETIENYQETLWAVEQFRFDDAFTYAYSPREDTPAYALKETMSHEEKISRLRGLITIQRRISLEKLKERIGRTEQVIPEKISKKSGSQLMGRTFLNHPVIIDSSPDNIGRPLNVKIQEVKGSTLYGTQV